jgi:hypothetical protein
VNEQKEKIKESLTKLFDNLDTGMTYNKYEAMQEQLGREINDEEAPPRWEDFPEIVINAVNIFNMLGDRIYPEVGYIGKDYTNLCILIEQTDINDKEFFLEILSWLDQRAIKKSSDQLKKEYDKLKRKSSGK